MVGLLHPGEMGAAVGHCLTGAGHRVLWASEGRGPESAARARGAGLQDVGTAAEMADRAEIILSILPPHAALDMSWAVQGFSGIFADANAIAPATAREIARMIEDGGGSYVDGGIIGPPPVTAGSTRLYLSGPRAAEVRELFAATTLTARVVSGSTTAASAVKMAYAAWTKGSGALLLTARALARARASSRRCSTSGRCPSPRSPAGQPDPPRRPAPRDGAGWPRWKKSPRAWPRPACRMASTRPPPRSSAAPRRPAR